MINGLTSQHQIPLISHTYLIPYPIKTLCSPWKLTKTPITPLPSLPRSVPRLPSFVSSNKFFTSYDAQSYPPKVLAHQPSNYTLSNHSTCSKSLQESADKEPWYAVKAIDSQPVWIGCLVTVSQRGEDDLRVRTRAVRMERLVSVHQRR